MFTENQPLSFGTIVIISFGVVGRVTVTPTGGYTYNSNIWIIDPPQIGEYELQNFPPNMVYTVSLPPSVDLTGGGGPFTLDNLETRPLTLVTDASGNDTFTISGRLQTLGGGTNYSDGNYDVGYTITLNF